MANNPTAPQKLVVPQQTDIHLNNPATGKAIQTIVNYVNQNVTPVQGNKVATRRTAPGGSK
jgi:hypothetical protein